MSKILFPVALFPECMKDNRLKETVLTMSHFAHIEGFV